ncbi:hypothetical protein METBIDRAFT_34483 [Metschnikowia bicuspidata var. bicuspidata NRRL YB-4993]|uniref:Uncharacterized protein n=1 Tax=Metschnikowia bicuspidata var. bicuspidata NRRL YB-4993 TaxID=869754 RepID=A0A1A0HFP7_9ASCO|nr:hypothetical protein METBIDRAFT_34483 [Metschnikowia bicuspidata var. bicuspidata NRRL YB-4993]OBA22810.1 hypothetical protein METBIDRAFT_34483 [Metschnikowia bicuspidata var. bicuspidata NRRL YB-4993]
MIPPVSYRLWIPGARVSTRSFSLSRFHTKNKNKVQLKNLGSFLLKGKVGEENTGKNSVNEVEVFPQLSDTQTSLEDFVDQHAKEIEESSFQIGYMGKDDIKFQEYLDSGRQFGGSGSGLVFRRIAAINSLPEEIDVIKTPWDEIERVYGVLKELDNDPGVHFKYKKRLAINTKSLLAVRNKKLTDMCKFARRDQKRQMLPLDLAFEGIFQYNVVGFDRSLAGVPLQTGKHAFLDKKQGPQFPVELLEDSRPFETKIPIHKKEVNFMEDDALEETLMPHDVKPNSPEDLLLMEGKPIMIRDIDDYNTLEHLLESLKAKIEEQVFSLQKALSSEITRSTMSLFLSFSGELKRNEYLLVSKSPYSTKYTGPTFKYALKFFDLIPFYGTLFTTVKHRTSLKRHLHKMIMLNLIEQIDSLTRIKYKLPADRRAFLDKTQALVKLLINDTLVPMIFKDRVKVPQHVHAVTHKQMKDSSFARIYWLRRPARLDPRNRKPLERTQSQYIEVAQATDL